MSGWSWWAVSITQPEREIYRIRHLVGAASSRTNVGAYTDLSDEEIVCRARDEIEAFACVKRWLEESK